MDSINSARRQQYFNAEDMPRIRLQNGVLVNIKYLETYPSSFTLEKLHISIAAQLKKHISGKQIGQNLDLNDEFFESYEIEINEVKLKMLASFKLQFDGIYYFIELLLIS